MKIKPGKKIKTFLAKDGRKVLLRFVRFNDWKDLLVLINSLVEEKAKIVADKKFSVKKEKEYVKRILKMMKEGEGIYIVPEINGRVVGMCSLKRGRGYASHVGELGLSLLKEYRGKGIGKALLKTCLEIGKEMGIEIVTLGVYDNNKIALKLYRKLGFKRFGLLKKGIKRGKKYINLIYMYKVL